MGSQGASPGKRYWEKWEAGDGPGQGAGQGGQVIRSERPKPGPVRFQPMGVLDMIDLLIQRGKAQESEEEMERRIHRCGKCDLHWTGHHCDTIEGCNPAGILAQRAAGTCRTGRVCSLWFGETEQRWTRKPKR